MFKSAQSITVNRGIHNLKAVGARHVFVISLPSLTLRDMFEMLPECPTLRLARLATLQSKCLLQARLSIYMLQEQSKPPPPFIQRKVRTAIPFGQGRLRLYLQSRAATCQKDFVRCFLRVPKADGGCDAMQQSCFLSK